MARALLALAPLLAALALACGDRWREDAEPPPPAAEATPEAPSATPAPTSTPASTPTAAPTAADPTPDAASSASATPVATPATPVAAPATPAPSPTASATPPLPVLDPPPGPFTSIRTDGKACALAEGGEVVCWTSTRHWRPAPGRRYETLASTSCAIDGAGAIDCWDSPRREELEDNGISGRYAAVDFGAVTSCALTDDGEGICWPGPASDWHEVKNAVPATLPGRYEAISVSSSGGTKIGWASNVCALTLTGEIECYYDEPHPNFTPPSGGGFKAVSASGFGGCALTDGGAIVCWGRRSSAPPGDYRALSVSWGTWGHGCAITAAGGAVCWGGFRTRMTPPDPAPDDPYAEISVSGALACALTEAGEAVCWEAEDDKIATPDLTTGRYRAVSSGVGHDCALTDAGEAVCWGWNHVGQAEPPPGRYKAISAHFVDTCAITDAGEAVCWGADYGREPPPGRYKAIAGHCALTEDGEAVCWDNSGGPPPGRYAAISASEYAASCALTEVGGEVVCWRRGRGHDDSRTPIVAKAPSGRHKAVSTVSESLACAITAVGEAVCWGSTRSLGALPSGPFEAIDAGGEHLPHVCALTAAGRAVCWMDGSYHGEADPPPSRDRYLALSVSEFRTCALTDTGDITCWGDTDYVASPRGH